MSHKLCILPPLITELSAGRRMIPKLPAHGESPLPPWPLNPAPESLSEETIWITTEICHRLVKRVRLWGVTWSITNKICSKSSKTPQIQSKNLILKVSFNHIQLPRKKGGHVMYYDCDLPFNLFYDFCCCIILTCSPWMVSNLCLGG